MALRFALQQQGKQSGPWAAPWKSCFPPSPAAVSQMTSLKILTQGEAVNREVKKVGGGGTLTILLVTEGTHLQDVPPS